MIRVVKLNHLKGKKYRGHNFVHPLNVGHLSVVHTQGDENAAQHSQSLRVLLREIRVLTFCSPHVLAYCLGTLDRLVTISSLI